GPIHNMSRRPGTCYSAVEVTMRRFLTLAGLSLVLAIVGVTLFRTMTASASTTHYVDPAAASAPPGSAGCGTNAGYTTIGAAVTASAMGDTIFVCPALYSEQVTVNKANLTLLGAQVGNDARTRPLVAANESIIDNACGPVQIEADNVVLDGFTVECSNLAPNTNTQ